MTVLYDTLRLFNGYRVRRDGPESGPNVIGPISLGVKQMGARGAGNPHAACDVEGWKRGTVERPPGAPVLDLTDERGRETECWPSALSHRARPRLYHRDNSLLATTASLQGQSGHEWTFMSGPVLPGKLSLLHGALSPRRAPTSKLPIIENPTGGVLAGRSSPPGTERGSKPEIFSRYHPAVGEYPDRPGDHWSCRLPRCVMGRAIASGWHGPPVF